MSSRHDSAFLREVLFPYKVKWLAKNGTKKLRPLMVYDDLWRLLRNAGFSGVQSLTEERTAGVKDIPVVVRQMASWQGRIPGRALRIGPLSKLIMLASYLRHLLNGKLY